MDGEQTPEQLEAEKLRILREKQSGKHQRVLNDDAAANFGWKSAQTKKGKVIKAFALRDKYKDEEGNPIEPGSWAIQEGDSFKVVKPSTWEKSYKLR